MTASISGIHHVTAIAGPPQPNVDFYAGLLGLRLVKKTVNFDDPGTYHLYYGDEAGRPGTILTFFPWSYAARGRVGQGMATETAFAVPPEALDFWQRRLAEAGLVVLAGAERFGRPLLCFDDPDGLRLELVGTPEAAAQPGWAEGRVPAAHAIRSFFGVTLAVPEPPRTARLLTEVFGYEHVGESDGRLRFAAPSEAAARVIDLVQSEADGRPGAGTIHHVAFRARDDDEQRAWREAILDFGLYVTDVKDRNYFHSIYFREPGGVLFEIATDPPGFTADEALGTLGTDLKLPPWLEPQRARLEAQLPALRVPTRIADER